MDRRTYLGLMLGGLAAALPMHGARAADRTLRMALTTGPTSLDPHFHDAFTSAQALLQIYSPLISQDPTGALIPGLATSWKALDDTTWELKLREGVTFHDGTPFEPEDIEFSFKRAANIPNSVASFISNVRDIVGVEIVDRTTVRIKTREPDPIFAYKLCPVCMLSRKLHAEATTAAMTAGPLAIGTGPYRYRSFAPGERLELVANPEFWGGKPGWDQLIIRYLSDPGARVAALSTGDVDIIDGVPVQDVAKLQSDPKIEIASTAAYLSVYLALDTSRETTPFVFDNGGKPLAKNPLTDIRVRQAIALAFDRQAIVDRLMAGQGTPASQLVSTAASDHARGLKPLPVDLAKAKDLLKQAGYPEGFQLTVHGPNGQFANDTAVLQALAQGLTRIGIRTTVETAPMAPFLSKASARAYSAFMAGFNSPYALITLRSLVMTADPKRGLGSSNRAAYSNAKVDELGIEALRTMDGAKRQTLIDQALKILNDDAGMIPIFYTRANWATRKGVVKFNANPMSRTSAFYAEPVA
jgi:peptide/nickel transport system substrate-binding protein